MEQQQHADDQSHYEISLTAAQAFLAFVLLLLSLAACFSFGLMIGRGQADERLVVRKEPAVVTEGSVLTPPKKSDARIVELGVRNDDFSSSEPAPTETTATSDAPVITEESAPAAAPTEPAVTPEASTPAPPPAPEKKPEAVATPARTPAPAPVVAKPAAPPAKPVNGGAVYAQLLSTGEQKAAESLAAKLIERGFTSAYVERGTGDKGSIYRVRVRFNSEPDARAAEAKLREFSKDVWIVR